MNPKTEFIPAARREAPNVSRYEARALCEVTVSQNSFHVKAAVLMNIAETQEDKEKYLNLCKRFEGVLTDKEVEYLKSQYDEDILDIMNLKGDENETAS